MMSTASPLDQLGGADRPALLAFPTDSETRDILIEVVQQYAPGTVAPNEAVHDGGIEGAIGHLSHAPSPRVLVIDLSGAANPLAEIDRLAEVCQPGTTVIALGQVNDIGLFRGLVSAGVADYLVKPVTSDMLLTALHAARTRAADSATPKAKPEEEGAVIAVVGTRGGVGATTVAVNTAWIIADELQHRVAVVDLDLHFGTVPLALDVEPGHGLCEALEDPSRVDGLFIASSAVNVSENLYVLGAEESFESPVTADPGALDMLLAELKRNFEWIVLDVPRGDSRMLHSALAAAQGVAVVSDLSLAGLRDAVRLFEFAKSAAPGIPPRLVINRAGAVKAGAVAKAEFEKGLGGKVDHILPEDAKALGRASATGKALPVAAKGSKVTVELRRLTRLLTGEETERKRFTLWHRGAKRAPKTGTAQAAAG